MNRTVISLGSLAAAAALACSSATPPASPPPASPAAVAATATPGGVAPTPTPGVLSRVNPYIVEETDTYTIQRYPKSEYIRIDDRHIRHPLLAKPIEFFREDDDYYYVSVSKRLPDEDALKRESRPPATPAPGRAPEGSPKPTGATSPAEFADLLPPRAGGRIRLQPLASGLPTEGLWRASFEIADVNGDGKADVVSPPARIGGHPYLHIWVGDGTGRFARWQLTFTEAGKERASRSIDYGGVSVSDIDRDGQADVATASHNAGLAVFLGDGKGAFRVVHTGLPRRDFSAQAIVLLDANRDGILDIVTSRDVVGSVTNQPVDRQQVRVYLAQPDGSWAFKEDGLVGGFYSNSLHAWDYDGDGLKDVLTGSHYNGALTLLWKNAGNGTFTPVSFPEIETHAYHFATAPGTFGKDRAPAFADAYYVSRSDPAVFRAAGISLYAFRRGQWTRHRVWRKRESKTLQYAVALGDLDGDRLDDVVFPDSETRRLRIFFQQPDGSFVEAEEKEEPALSSPGQCVRLADLDGDGRLDVVLAKTVSSTKPDDRGGWDVYLNKR